jgi:GT2 family glycosyltransferase
VIDVSIVIVNWNAGEHLARAVSSAFADPLAGRREVIVVDNASTDDSMADVARIEAGVRLMRMPTNTGFARACNVGVRASGGRYAVLLNPDAELCPGALGTLVALADAYPDAAVLGGSVVAPDGTLDPASRRNIPTPAMAFARLFRLPGLSRVLGLPPYNVTVVGEGEAPEVGAVSGSFMLLRRSAFDALGGFDERFFLYAEDLDFCLRAPVAGWTVRSTGRAVAVHHKHVSAAQAPYRTLWHFYRTMILFHRKHYARERSLLVNLAVYSGVAAVFAARVLKVTLAWPGKRFQLATARRPSPAVRGRATSAHSGGLSEGGAVPPRAGETGP